MNSVTGFSAMTMARQLIQVPEHARVQDKVANRKSHRKDPARKHPPLGDSH
jgi:hypothetical protein